MTEQPTTSEVLKVIGRRGVVVGSYATATQPGDVDIVVKARHPDSRRHPVFAECLVAWPNHCESSITGHLCVHAAPLAVEIFEDKGWPVDDPVKSKGMLTYQQAVRRGVEQMVFGIPMRTVRRAV